MMTFNKKYFSIFIAIILIVVIILVEIWFSKQQNYEQQDSASDVYYGFDISLQDSTIIPIPQTITLDKRKVILGDRLFHDPRLSKGNTVSCSSCHNLKLGGTVPLAKAIGMENQKGDRNSPTVFNSIFNIAQFWDGRARTLEDQIDGPVGNSKEMASNWLTIISKLKQNDSYADDFGDIYPDGITSNSIKNAIATFERSLITPNSRFDQYLRGDKSILTEEEISGYQMFRAFGCSSCHQGVNIGSNLYQKFGVFIETQQDNENSDLGRFSITGVENDKFVFKVPSLRNIALTAPYFHDGSAKTLADAVKTMGEMQLGRHLNDSETTKIVSFLKTLTGEYKGEPL